MKLFLKKHYDLLGRFRALYLISAIELTFIITWSFFTGDGVNYYLDTSSYYDAYDVIMSGRLSIERTPLYPLIIGIPKSIFGDNASVAFVYILQSLLFIISINWIGKTLDSITPYKKIAYWFTAVYAFYPGVLLFCGIIMTESISISLVALVLYLVSGTYYNHSRKKAILSGLTCILLWMLRPSLILFTLFLIPFWSVVLLFVKNKRNKAMLYGLLSALFSFACLIFYSMSFHNQYNMFGVSFVTTNNNYLTIRGANIIDVKSIESPRMRKDVDSLLNANGYKGETMRGKWWEEIDVFVKRYDLADYNDFVNDQLRKHPKGLWNFLYIKRMDDLLDSSCINTGDSKQPIVSSLTRLFRVNNGTAFLIFLIGAAVLICYDFSHKRISLFVWLLFSLFAANYVTVWIGAPDQFSRLLAQNYPILISISCWLLSQLTMIATESPHYISNSHRNSTIL